MSGCVLLAATRSPDLGQREGTRTRDTSSLRAAAAVLHLPGSSCLSLEASTPWSLTGCVDYEEAPS